MLDVFKNKTSIKLSRKVGSEEQMVDIGVDLETYSFKKVIGRGNFGEVHEAFCNHSLEKVAIKNIRGLKDDYDYVKLIREISIMKHLNDSNGNIFIPQLIDVKIEDENFGSAKIVMKCHGIDLRTHLQTATITAEDLRQILYNILCALCHIHESNVIHRDIKPENILIDPETNDVKICDFGLSRTLPDSVTCKGSGSTKRMRNGIFHKNLLKTRGVKNVNKMISN